MNCVKCNAELKDGSRFCNICGAPQTPKCVKCGVDLEAGSRFCNICGAPQTEAAPAAPVAPAVPVAPVPVAPAAPAAPAADVLVKRARIMIHSGDFAKALECCNKALELDPENAELYLLLLMSTAEVAEEVSLKFLPDLPGDPNFKLARQFASPELAARLDAIQKAWEAEQPLKPLRAACVQRQQMLRSLPANVVGDAQAQLEERLAAEQALMAALSPEAAQREKEATQAFCKKLFVPIFNVQLMQLGLDLAPKEQALAYQIRALSADPAASCEDMLRAEREVEALLGKKENREKKGSGNNAVVFGVLGLVTIIAVGRVLPFFIDKRANEGLILLSVIFAIGCGGIGFIYSLLAFQKTRGRAIVGLVLTALTVFNIIDYFRGGLL